MRRLRFALESATFRLLLAAARAVPRRVALRLGAGAGRLGAVVDRRHRRIALDNLRLAFGPQLEARRARRLVSDTWAHFGRILVDALYFPRLGPDAIGTLVHYEGLDVLRAAYARGRGVVVFSGHFGHWELTALMQGFLDLPLALVARPLDNQALERMLAELRGRSGNRVLHKRNAIREALRELRAGRGVAIVLDQDARSEGVFVPFFGRPASTTPTLALLALRTGAAVVPTYSLPRPDGSYLVVYGPEVEVTATGDREADILRITARCTAILEGWVRRWPELWLWMHRRWKTRPSGG
jgi:KDO2-lipid IV(A) lauroyltransferase